MTRDTAKESKVFWQDVYEGEGVPEPAILINAYNDTISLEQDGESVLINYASMEKLFKAMRELKNKFNPK